MSGVSRFTNLEALTGNDDFWKLQEWRYNIQGDLHFFVSLGSVCSRADVYNDSFHGSCYLTRVNKARSRLPSQQNLGEK
jgi:hypothetical protein